MNQNYQNENQEYYKSSKPNIEKASITRKKKKVYLTTNQMQNLQNMQNQQLIQDNFNKMSIAQYQNQLQALSLQQNKFSDINANLNHNMQLTQMNNQLFNQQNFQETRKSKNKQTKDSNIQSYPIENPILVNDSECEICKANNCYPRNDSKKLNEINNQSTPIENAINTLVNESECECCQANHSFPKNESNKDYQEAAVGTSYIEPEINDKHNNQNEMMNQVNSDISNHQFDPKNNIQEDCEHCNFEKKLRNTRSSLSNTHTHINTMNNYPDDSNLVQNKSINSLKPNSNLNNNDINNNHGIDQNNYKDQYQNNQSNQNQNNQQYDEQFYNQNNNIGNLNQDDKINSNVFFEQCHSNVKNNTNYTNKEFQKGQNQVYDLENYENNQDINKNKDNLSVSMIEQIIDKKNREFLESIKSSQDIFIDSLANSLKETNITKFNQQSIFVNKSQVSKFNNSSENKLNWNQSTNTINSKKNKSPSPDHLKSKYNNKKLLVDKNGFTVYCNSETIENFNENLNEEKVKQNQNVRNNYLVNRNFDNNNMSKNIQNEEINKINFNNSSENQFNTNHSFKSLNSKKNKSPSPDKLKSKQSPEKIFIDKKGFTVYCKPESVENMKQNKQNQENQNFSTKSNSSSLNIDGKLDKRSSSPSRTIFKPFNLSQSNWRSKWEKNMKSSMNKIN